jgi:hypothetical protein
MEPPEADEAVKSARNLNWKPRCVCIFLIMLESSWNNFSVVFG